MKKRTKSQTFADVWEALEDTPEEAASMRLRAQLMIEIQRFVAGAGLSQTAAARRLGLTQPRLSDLMRGRIEKFSLDALVNMLARIGRSVAVRVGRAA